MGERIVVLLSKLEAESDCCYIINFDSKVYWYQIAMKFPVGDKRNCVYTLWEIILWGSVIGDLVLGRWQTVWYRYERPNFDIKTQKDTRGFQPALK